MIPGRGGGVPTQKGICCVLTDGMIFLTEVFTGGHFVDQIRQFKTSIMKVFLKRSKNDHKTEDNVP